VFVEVKRMDSDASVETDFPSRAPARGGSASQEPRPDSWKAAQEQMLLAVEEADALVVHSTRYAVALRHEPLHTAAPSVVARGMDRLADRIREIARQHRVPSVEDPILAAALYRHAQVGQPVPTELSHAVEQVLAYAEQLRSRRPARYLPLHEGPER
jgi:flagellar biosynthesis protein FlhB